MTQAASEFGHFLVPEKDHEHGKDHKNLADTYPSEHTPSGREALSGFAPKRAGRAESLFGEGLIVPQISGKRKNGVMVKRRGPAGKDFRAGSGIVFPPLPVVSGSGGGTFPPWRSMDRQARIKTFRLRKGWTQEELARKAGVRRQAVYDMESGRYLPNTAVALELARLLGCAVEDLFLAPAPLSGDMIRIPDGAGPARSRLVLGRVRGTLIGLPAGGADASSAGLAQADAFLPGPGLAPEIITPASVLERTLLIVGCNPALETLDAHFRHILPSGRARRVFASSAGALRILAHGGAHVAAIHFHSHGRDEANVEAARIALPGTALRILRFSVNEEGLMVARGNPLNIRSAVDLARSPLRFVNREEGAALRRLLDARLAEAGVPATAVNGYETIALSHGEGAARVACGVADAALGLAVVAESFGLDFVPLAVTGCDLVIPEDLADTPPVAALLEILHFPVLRGELARLPGYDASATGMEITRIG